jgi:hypothetical protein
MTFVQHKPTPDYRRSHACQAACELERYHRELMRIRLEIGELKRIGSQRGLPELTSDALRLSMRIKRFENYLSRN